MIRHLSILFLISLAFPFAAAKAQNPSYSTYCLWDENGARKHVYLTRYLPDPDKRIGKSVVVCPGGSYFWLAKDNEGSEVGRWLSEHGICAYVLSYRVAGKFNFISDMRFLYGGNHYPAMLEDAQRAILFLRSNADECGVSADDIGLMGFSAGGHLAMLTEEQKTLPHVRMGGLSSRPDFVVMIYPVVTMSDNDIVHRRSRRGLMGLESGETALRDSLSLEKHVPADCCPVFLLNCRDDDVVDYRNSIIMDKALTEAGIPHEYHLLPCGGHGFGIKPAGSGADAVDWTELLLNWLKSL